MNQYNVFAYKKVIRGVNVCPSFTGVKPSGISELTYDVSRKISNDGKYIGVVGGYNFDDSATNRIENYVLTHKSRLAFNELRLPILDLFV